jgi:beta-galactosidase
VTDALREQVVQLTALSPGRRLLTNHYLGDAVLDCREVGRLTGLVGHDNYPHGAAGPVRRGLPPRPVPRPGRRRGALGGRAAARSGQLDPTNPPVPPGQVRLWGWQAALHGVDTLLFFRWRAARYGQEQYHAGLLRHDATPDRGLAEAVRLGEELRSADPALLRRPPARVALTYAYDDAWALEIDPHAAGLTHRSLVVAAQEAASRCGQDVDVVDPTADLTGYEVVLAPALHLRTPQRLAALTAASTRAPPSSSAHAAWSRTPTTPGSTRRCPAGSRTASGPGCGTP